MNKIQLLSVCATFLLAVSNAADPGPAATRYDDFKVYRVSVDSDQQLNEFKKLSNNFPVQHLSDIGGPGRSYDVVVEPGNQDLLEKEMKNVDLGFNLVIDDLQKVLDESKLKATSIPEPMEWTQYHGLFDIYNWLDNIAAKHKRIITSYTIGYSYEGRPIKAVKISAKASNKAIFIESSIHAIEWISSATSTCFIDNLLKSKSFEMMNLLSNYDWIFVPVLNPDGFEYSHNVERLWRKNRKPTGFSNSSGICYGIDLNRNFNFKWGGTGWNVNVPCDHWYGGAQPDSEPEIIALESFVERIMKIKKNYIRMYLAFHSYGNLVLLPYGHSNTEIPSNFDQMMRIANSFASAAKVRYGTNFLAGASGVLLYPASGAAKDWAYGVKKIPFTATLELRDSGKYGFFLPSSQILEVCAEVTDGLIAMVKQATAEGLFK